MSDEVVPTLCAGGILLNKDKSKICVLLNKTTGRVELPKGHQEKGETLAAVASRETHEETGYRNKIMDAKNDLIAVYVRQLPNSAEWKIIYYYLCVLETNEDDREEGTQDDYENFESLWLPLEEATKRLTYPGQAQIVAHAHQVVEPSANIDFKESVTTNLAPINELEVLKDTRVFTNNFISLRQL